MIPGWRLSPRVFAEIDADARFGGDRGHSVDMFADADNAQLPRFWIRWECRGSAGTDAFAQEGLDKAIERAKAYVAAGADGIFAEAVQTEEHYRAFAEALDVPILANITEFGKTELWNKEELGEWGADMVLYPLSAFRAMNKAAEMVYKSILENGDQKAVVDSMQTRMELYDYLGYHEYEQKLDALFAEGKN